MATLIHIPLCAAMSCGVLAQPAFADITSQKCADVRAKANESSTRWVGLDAAETLTPLTNGESVNTESIDKIVYLHRRDDGNTDATVVAVKITFRTEGNEADRNWIRIKNNFKNAFSVKYTDYQDFHTGAKEHFKIKNNFHLSKGWFRQAIPFTTFDPEDRRSELLYAEVGENDEKTFRSYLFLLDGVQPGGSCVDFKPVIPDATKALRVQIIDLRENVENAIHYRGTLDLELN
jgi:hypothetical protein